MCVLTNRRHGARCLSSYLWVADLVSHVVAGSICAICTNMYLFIKLAIVFTDLWSFWIASTEGRFLRRRKCLLSDLSLIVCGNTKLLLSWHQVLFFYLFFLTYRCTSAAFCGMRSLSGMMVFSITKSGLLDVYQVLPCSL